VKVEELKLKADEHSLALEEERFAKKTGMSKCVLSCSWTQTRWVPRHGGIGS
jgi:hypothetical protein